MWWRTCLSGPTSTRPSSASWAGWPSCSSSCVSYSGFSRSKFLMFFYVVVFVVVVVVVIVVLCCCCCCWWWCCSFFVFVLLLLINISILEICHYCSRMEDTLHCKILKPFLNVNKQLNVLFQTWIAIFKNVKEFILYLF